MTEREAYINGFCKVAEANGVDPEALAQFAEKQAQSVTGHVPSHVYAPKTTTPTLMDKINSYFKTLRDKSKASSGASKANIGSLFRKTTDK